MPLRTYRDLIEIFNAASSVEEIHTACARLCEEFKFDFFLYGKQVPTSFVAPRIFIISGFPDAWWQRYKEANHIHIDPTITHCRQSTLPICWNHYRSHLAAGSEADCFMREAQDYGLADGGSFPVHGPHGEKALFSVGTHHDTPRHRQRMAELLPQLHLLTHHLHECIGKILTLEELPCERPALSRRERECLLWAAEGKTAWETGRILGISERTAVFHLNNAAAKLQVGNRQHAVARAISLGLIQPQLG